MAFWKMMPCVLYIYVNVWKRKHLLSSFWYRSKVSYPED
jgi:hypothetical protein